VEPRSTAFSITSNTHEPLLRQNIEPSVA